MLGKVSPAVISVAVSHVLVPRLQTEDSDGTYKRIYQSTHSDIWQFREVPKTNPSLNGEIYSPPKKKIDKIYNIIK